MIRIARAALPKDVSDRLNTLTNELKKTALDSRKAAARALWERSSTRDQVRAPLRQTLHGMALGLEQCMYCGTDFGTDVDHFEPVAWNPLGTFHWPNHLLACSTCNSNHKRDQFPLDNNGQPLLINPTMDDPFEHLTLSLSTDMYHWHTPQGEATIEVCGLNRRQLVDGRRRSRALLVICLRQWAVAHNEGDDCYQRDIVQTIRQQPFADVCQTMLRQAKEPRAEDIFSDAEPTGLSPELLRLLLMPELRQALLM